ncbi:MAG: hypothetical protein MZU97_13910 [Bacillus subtilis]|nr:hypothetical protein [Bacillus subtilis]
MVAGEAAVERSLVENAVGNAGGLQLGRQIGVGPRLDKRAADGSSGGEDFFAGFFP